MNVLEDGSIGADQDPFSQAATGFFKAGRANKQDVVVQDEDIITPYVNSGDGVHFTAKAALPNTPPVTQLYGGQIIVGDADGDGNGDVIIPYYNVAGATPANPASAYPNKLYLWYGKGDGTFANPVITTLSRNYYLAALVDMNGDGLADLVLSDGYVVSILYNLGNRQFGNEAHVLAGQGINQLSVADVNGDGSPDLIATNGGATISYPVALGGLNAAPTKVTLARNPDVNNGGITVLLNNVHSTAVTGLLTATPEPTGFGSPFSITAAVSPAGSTITPTGTVTFMLDGNLLGSGDLMYGVATISVPSSIYSTLAPGTHALAASYSGDGTYSPRSFTGTHVVQPAPTTMSLLLCVDPPGSNFPCGNPINTTPLISPISMFYGQSLDGVAIESSTTLTGTITFYSGASVFCVLNANLQQGSQTCPPTSGIFPPGTTTVTAAYSGDANNAPSVSNGIVVTVYPDLTTATVTSSLNPANFGQAVTFTANVQGNYATGSGQVIFLDGGATIATATLDASGHATFTTSTLSVGTHAITVAFPGSASFQSTTSPVLSQTILAVNPPVQSVLTLTSSLNPSAAGQFVTFTATVSATGSTTVIPTGTVTFYDGTATIGTATLNPATGIATLTTSALAIGTHPVTASYGGAIGKTVPPPNPPTPPPPAGAHVVQPVSGGFRLIGPAAHSTTVQLPSVRADAFAPPPVAATTWSAPQPQITSITPTILASTSNVVNQIVTAAPPPDFRLTVSPNPVTAGVGGTAVLLIGIQPVAGFSQTVALSCTGLPAEASCIFVQPTMPVGGGTTTLQLSVAAPHTCGTTTPYFVADTGSRSSGSVAAVAVPALFAGGFVFAGLRRRRKGPWIVLTVAAASLCGLAMVSGCGTCTDLGTRPGSYSFTVVATPQGGAVTQAKTQSVPLTVTTQ